VQPLVLVFPGLEESLEVLVVHQDDITLTHQVDQVVEVFRLPIFTW
jgi:hypothetical protein